MLFFLMNLQCKTFFNYIGGWTLTKLFDMGRWGNSPHSNNRIHIKLIYQQRHYSKYDINEYDKLERAERPIILYSFL